MIVDRSSERMLQLDRDKKILIVFLFVMPGCIKSPSLPTGTYGRFQILVQQAQTIHRRLQKLAELSPKKPRGGRLSFGEHLWILYIVIEKLSPMVMRSIKTEPHVVKTY